MNSTVALALIPPLNATTVAMAPLSRALLPFFTFLLFGSAAYASVVSDILKALENAVDCGACHAVLALLDPIAHLGDSAFSSTLTAVCKAAKVSDRSDHILALLSLTMFASGCRR